jgi:integrase
MPRLGRGPRLDFRRGCWVIRWTEDGRSCERRTGETDRAIAEEKLADFLATRRERPTGYRPEGRYLISDLLAEYGLEHGPEVASKETLGCNTMRLLEYWSGKTVSEVIKANCQAYAVRRRKEGVTDSTIRRELGVLSAALGHARSNERLREHPKVWMPEDGPAKERWLTRREASRLLRAARFQPQAKHLPLFILLGLYGGARKSAILDLRWSQVDLENGRIDWSPPGRRQTKKRRAKIPIRRRLLTFLRYAKAHGSDLGPVLTQRVTLTDGSMGIVPIGDVKKAFAAAVKRAKLEPSKPWMDKNGRKLRNPTSEELAEYRRNTVTPHTLRHTCGTWMAQAGVPLWEIAGFLGHTVQRTTELYAHHHPDYMERARLAF